MKVMSISERSRDDPGLGGRDGRGAFDRRRDHDDREDKSGSSRSLTRYSAWWIFKAKRWNFHAVVTKEYTQLFELPVHLSKVIEINEKKKFTAGFLDKSWQKPKEAVYVFWIEYNAVISFFEISKGQATCHDRY